MPPTSDDSKPKESDSKPKEPDPVSFISTYMFISCKLYIHVYFVQDDEDAQHKLTPEPQTEEAKEKLSEKVSHIHVEVYVCTWRCIVGGGIACIYLDE